MADQPLLPGIDPACPVPGAFATPRADTLWQYPNCAALTLKQNAKALGHAGELFVDSVFARLGLHASTVSEGLPYDRLLLVDGEGIRVQVKTTTNTQSGAFRFTATQGYHRSPAGVRPYAEDAFDILALVALPENAVFFTTSKALTHGIPVAQVPMLRARPQITLTQALRSLGHAVPELPSLASLRPAAFGGGRLQ